MLNDLSPMWAINEQEDESKRAKIMKPKNWLVELSSPWYRLSDAEDIVVDRDGAKTLN